VLDEELAEVRMRRYNGTPEWEVVIVRRGAKMSYKCRNYDLAMKWARVECRSYRSSRITVEREASKPNCPGLGGTGAAALMRGLRRIGLVQTQA
jgi:hypothetical protein